MNLSQAKDRKLARVPVQTRFLNWVQDVLVTDILPFILGLLIPFVVGCLLAAIRIGFIGKAENVLSLCYGGYAITVLLGCLLMCVGALLQWDDLSETLFGDYFSPLERIWQGACWHIAIYTVIGIILVVTKILWWMALGLFIMLG